MIVLNACSYLVMFFSDISHYNNVEVMTNFSINGYLNSNQLPTIEYLC